MACARRVILFIAILASGAIFAEEAAERSTEDKLTEAAIAHRLRLDFDDGAFSGLAWDRLVAEGKSAQFFLMGEEHGIAENPKLAAQLFAELSNHGYSKVAIEISPTMARLLDEALMKDGLDGLRDLFAQPGGEPTFFGMAEEAEMLAALEQVMKGRTTLIIAHRTSTLALVDQVVFLDEGQIVAIGPHLELLATVPRYGEVLAQEEALR